MQSIRLKSRMKFVSLRSSLSESEWKVAGESGSSFLVKWCKKGKISNLQEQLRKGLVSSTFVISKEECKNSVQTKKVRFV